MPVTEPEINPYRSPESVDAPRSERAPSRLLFAVSTILLSTVAGSLLGGATNAINGLVYPWHFSNLAPPGTSDLWRVATVRGIEEGAVYGVLNGALVAIAVFALRIRDVKRLMPVRLILTGSILVLGAWLVGGLSALAIPLMGLKPTHDFYYDIGSGFWTGDRRWVLWSIRGAVWGAPFCSLAALAISLRRIARKSQPEPAP